MADSGSRTDETILDRLRHKTSAQKLILLSDPALSDADRLAVVALERDVTVQRAAVAGILDEDALLTVIEDKRYRSLRHVAEARYRELGYGLAATTALNA